MLVALALLTGCLTLPEPAPLPQGAPPNVYAVGLRVFEGADFRCSGVLTGPNTALSAAHCFAEMRESGLFYVTRDPHAARNFVVRALIDEKTDVAVLELATAEPAPYAAKGAPPELGSLAWIVGYGCSWNPWGVRIQEARTLWLFARAPRDVYGGVACAGDSGGGIYDAGGGLIGLTSMRSTQGPQNVYAAPIDFVDW